jgi:beta-phosphoglucomutase-like phosphatase (HAD superfamily)
VVEDAPAGVTAARAANCPCLALTTTLPASYLQPCQPTAIVASHGELQQFLRAIFA